MRDKNRTISYFAETVQALLAVLCCFLVMGTARADCSARKPVVIIPGIMGTVLEGKAQNIPKDVYLPLGCPRSFKNHRMWIAGENFLPYYTNCYQEYMKLQWDEYSRGAWSTVPGVNITVPRFGELYAVEALDPSLVFKDISQMFVKFKKHMQALGYVDGVDLLSAGYDWRHVPSAEWMDATARLIERAVKTTGRKAVLVAHSMGCPYTYAFLKSQPRAWVKQHIDSFVGAGGPWAGAPKAANAFFVGFADYVPIAGYAYAALTRHLASVWLLLPRAEGLGANELLAITPSRNYTNAELEQLLSDGGMDHTAEKLAASRAIFTKWSSDYSEPLDVPVACLTGTGMDTAGTIVFDKDIERGTPDGGWTHSKTTLAVDGDGTVPLASTRYACDQWAKHGGNATTVLLEGSSHLSMLKDARFFDEVTRRSCEN